MAFASLVMSSEISQKHGFKYRQLHVRSLHGFSIPISQTKKANPIINRFMNYAARCLKILVEQVTRNITLPIYFSQVKLSLLFSSLPKNRLVHEQMFSNKNGGTMRHPEFTCTFCGFCSSGFEIVVFINNSNICKKRGISCPH